MSRNPITIFVSYASLDEQFMGPSPRSLQPVFEQLAKDDDIELFWDHRIQAGTYFETELNTRLNECSIALMLLSPSFFASDYIAQKELPVLQRRFLAGEISILPIYLSPCQHNHEWLRKLQRVPHRKSIAELPKTPKAMQGVLHDVERHLNVEIQAVRSRRAEGMVGGAARSRIYLRRRCRVIPKPSAKLQKFMKMLLMNEHQAERRPRLLQFPATLPTSFETTMAQAMLFEAMGKVNGMLKELSSVSLKGREEACRLLYRGIAYEKLWMAGADNLSNAIVDYRRIIDQPDVTVSPLLRKAAQFNLSVCLEKQEQYEGVHFTEFLADHARLPSGEKIWHKAIVMEMIVCQKTGKLFEHDNRVATALREQLSVDPSGYAKTLITWRRYHQTPPNDSDIRTIIRLQAKMPTNARAAIVCELAKDLAAAKKWKAFNTLTGILRKLYVKSGDTTVAKYLTELGPWQTGATESPKAT